MAPEVRFAIDPPPGRGIRSSAPITLHCLACDRYLPIAGAIQHLSDAHPGQERDVYITTRGLR